MPALVVLVSYGQIIQIRVSASTTLNAASMRCHADTSRADRLVHSGSARTRTARDGVEVWWRLQ